MRSLSDPPVFNIKLDAALNPVEAVIIPTASMPPELTFIPPAVISKPPALISTPLLAVTTPIESTLVTSSYVTVPAIPTSPSIVNFPDPDGFKPSKLEFH